MVQQNSYIPDGEGSGGFYWAFSDVKLLRQI